MIALKLLFLTSVFNLTQITGGDRPVLENDESGQNILSDSENAENTDRSRFDAYLDNDIEISEDLLKIKWSDREIINEIPVKSEVNYIASLKIGDILGLNSEGISAVSGNSPILIGVKRPSYRIYRRPYIRGHIDLNMSGNILGLENKGVVTVLYYFKSDDTYSRLSTSIAIDGFSYRLIIPFGGR